MSGGATPVPCATTSLASGEDHVLPWPHPPYHGQILEGRFHHHLQRCGSREFAATTPATWPRKQARHESKPGIQDMAPPATDTPTLLCVLCERVKPHVGTQASNLPRARTKQHLPDTPNTRRSK